jgi:hypothetical protein
MKGVIDHRPTGYSLFFDSGYGVQQTRAFLLIHEVDYRGSSSYERCAGRIKIFEVGVIVDAAGQNIQPVGIDDLVAAQPLPDCFDDLTFHQNVGIAFRRR